MERQIATQMNVGTPVVREAIAARVAAATPLTYLREAARFPGFPRALPDTPEEARLIIGRRGDGGDERERHGEPRS